MKVKIVVQGGGYDGMSHFKEIPDDSRFKRIKSIGIPTVDGRTANFPTISVSRKKIILDGEKLTWEMMMKKIPVFFQGGTLNGKTGTFDSAKEVDIFTLKGATITLGDSVFPVIDVSVDGLLLDATNATLTE